MKAKRETTTRLILLVSLATTLIALSSRMRADTGICGAQMITLPFTDVPASNTFFCSVAEAFFAGLTNGTSATAHSPSANVPREQMAAFITRAMDRSLKRGGRRAALNQYWTTQGANNLGLTTVGDFPFLCQSDRTAIWVANITSDTVSRVRTSNGKLLETWTGAGGPQGCCARRVRYLSPEGNPRGGDGTNTWVPNGASNSISVVRATGGFAGTVLATLTAMD